MRRKSLMGFVLIELERIGSLLRQHKSKKSAWISSTTPNSTLHIPHSPFPIEKVIRLAGHFFQWPCQCFFLYPLGVSPVYSRNTREK